MVNDARGHNVPAAGDAPRRQALLDLALSINDFVSVANTTDRAQKLSDIGASAARPLLVYRQDSGRFEWTTGGSTPVWRDLISRRDAQAPHLRLRRTTDQARTANTWGQAIFDATVDAAGDQPWTAPGDGSIVLTEAGLYMFDLSLSMTAPGTFACQLFRVGDSAVLDASPVATGTSFSNHAHVTRRFAAGDTVVARVFPTATGMSIRTDLVGTPSYMTVTRLSI